MRFDRYWLTHFYLCPTLSYDFYDINTFIIHFYQQRVDTDLLSNIFNEIPMVSV